MIFVLYFHELILMANKYTIQYNLKVWGGGGTEGFLKGGKPNSELVYTIRVYMISGRRGRGVSNF